MNKPKNIHPVSDRMLPRESREQLLQQKAKVFWLTGLSGSGKSTLAIALQNELHKAGKLCYILDGDNVRAGINSNLGFSDADRTENIRRIAEVARLFADAGIITLCSFVSPTVQIRELAKNIIGQNDFREIYVNASLESCEQRDVKGLYKKARAGEIKDFTGIHQPFEAPENPWLEIKTDKESFENSLQVLSQNVFKEITI
jgi:adenylylsulfate kinase